MAFRSRAWNPPIGATPQPASYSCSLSVAVLTDSGHMLCGVSRLSPRSIVATAVFFMTAVLTTKFFPAPVNVPPPAYQLAPFSAQGTLALLGTVLGFVAVKKLIDRVVPRCVKPNVPASDAAECERIVESPAGLATYLWAGLSFGVGLVMSGMISSLKVLGFLRLPPPLETFDPSLALVMAGGVLPNALSYFGMMKESNGNPKPRFGWEQWRVPSRRDINPRLIAGAAIFGAGWGLCGVCPGPAISTLGEIVVAAAQGASWDKMQPGVIAWAAYTANMVAGMGAVKLLDSVIA